MASIIYTYIYVARGMHPATVNNIRSYVASYYDPSCADPPEKAFGSGNFGHESHGDCTVCHIALMSDSHHRDRPQHHVLEKSNVRLRANRNISFEVSPGKVSSTALKLGEAIEVSTAIPKSGFQTKAVDSQAVSPASSKSERFKAVKMKSISQNQKERQRKPQTSF